LFDIVTERACIAGPDIKSSIANCAIKGIAACDALIKIKCRGRWPDI